jgi:phosphate transport system protein
MADLHLGEHISQKFNQDLESLRTSVLEMGGLVERQVADAVQSLVEANSEVARQVLAMEEGVDRKELMIDEECTKILAMRQPAASDLRLVLAVSKINLDLERIGDEASKIAEAAIALTEQGSHSHGYIEIRHLGSGVHTMVHDALDAFARFDMDMALKVMNDDKEIDREYGTALREMMTYMMEDPRSITRVMRIIWVLRSLERIGDHARNISEQVIYIVKGKDVRHISVSDVQKTVSE